MIIDDPVVSAPIRETTRTKLDEYLREIKSCLKKSDFISQAVLEKIERSKNGKTN